MTELNSDLREKILVDHYVSGVTIQIMSYNTVNFIISLKMIIIYVICDDEVWIIIAQPCFIVSLLI